jgi:hypothetical protein
MFYGQAGGKDLLQRKWKDLSEFVTLECDGKDITAKLREQKVHAVLFLNIPSYGGGTHPWNRAHGQEAATDDGLIEVVGLTTYQLVCNCVCLPSLPYHYQIIFTDFIFCVAFVASGRTWDMFGAVSDGTNCYPQNHTDASRWRSVSSKSIDYWIATSKPSTGIGQKTSRFRA